MSSSRLVESDQNVLLQKEGEGPSVPLIWSFPPLASCRKPLEAFAERFAPRFLSVVTEIKEPMPALKPAAATAATELRLYLYLLIRCFCFQTESRYVARLAWNSACRPVCLPSTGGASLFVAPCGWLHSALHVRPALPRTQPAREVASSNSDDMKTGVRQSSPRTSPRLSRDCRLVPFCP